MFDAHGEPLLITQVLNINTQAALFTFPPQPLLYFLPRHFLLVAKLYEFIVRYHFYDVKLVTSYTLDIAHHVPESCIPEVIWLNICNAALPRGTPPVGNADPR